MARSKVEVKGFEARHYDGLMNLITLGYYPRFIRSAVSFMDLPKDAHVLDIGCGTGRNARLIANHLGENSRVTGVDVGTEMLAGFSRKQGRDSRLSAMKADIRKRFPFPDNSFDGAFMAFVLHGLEHDDRLHVLTEIQRILKPGGKFYLLDYRPLDLKSSSLFTRFIFRLECDLASEFLTYNWEGILSRQGFGKFEEKGFFGKKVRILKSTRLMYTE
ncbi:MAG: class I SAM-dependent methyltransferase [Acidobacteria bacterium]|nr:class I SAM-dependent methyltransferase [Acidobacteriota bacterium]